ncbi:MAG: hypothetical protein AAF727_07580, partial [Pseudomonadota bacterium]
MRRNIDDLAKSFAELGHGDVTFSFEQSDMSEDQGDNPGDHAKEHRLITADPIEMTAETAVTTPYLAMARDGIDMRL